MQPSREKELGPRWPRREAQPTARDAFQPNARAWNAKAQPRIHAERAIRFPVKRAAIRAAGTAPTRIRVFEVWKVVATAATPPASQAMAGAGERTMIGSASPIQSVETSGISVEMWKAVGLTAIARPPRIGTRVAPFSPGNTERPSSARSVAVRAD